MKSQPAEVDAIVVNYNTRDMLLNCLKSLCVIRENQEIDRILVIDSGSSDGSLDAVSSAGFEVESVSVKNLGYGAAANLGLRTLSGKYALILNADTTVPQETVSSLAAYMQQHLDVAVAGPRLEYPGGVLQPSKRSFPDRLTPLFESTILQDWFPSNRWRREYLMAEVTDFESQAVDWVVGAALMVRREAYERVGGFDPVFRMFSEEVDWCYRFACHGWKVAYVPNVSIVHYEGQSTGQNVAARQANFDASRIELQRRLYGPRAAQLTRLMLKGNYLAIMVREGLKWMLGHRRGLRGQRIRMYANLLTMDLDLER